MVNSRLKFNHLLLKRLLLRQSCLLCKAPEAGNLAICKACLNALPFHHIQQCPQCALPAVNNQICGKCLSSPPAFDASRALFQYQFPIDNMLLRLKYGQMLNLADIFGNLMAQTLYHQQHFDLIIPMPLHPIRLKERGFNQSLEISKTISKQTNIPIDIHSTERIKHTPPQASYKERVKNMRNAFICNGSFTGLKILLVDDVMTTGASLNALATVVRKSGASHITCWSTARTLPR